MDLHLWYISMLKILSYDEYKFHTLFLFLLWNDLLFFQFDYSIVLLFRLVRIFWLLLLGLLLCLTCRVGRNWRSVRVSVKLESGYKKEYIHLLPGNFANKIIESLLIKINIKQYINNFLIFLIRRLQATNIANNLI